MAEEIQDTTLLNHEMSAGEMLRTARTTGRRKREISTIAKQLCIREEFLQALEDGNYTLLPELVYILGFARNYAMELGIDPDIIVKKIKQEMCVESDDMHATYQSPCEQLDADKRKTKEKLNNNFQKIKNGKCYKFLIKYWKWIVGIVVLLAVIGGIIGVFIASSEPAVEQASVVVETSVAPSTEPAYRQTVRERFGTENRDDAEIVIQAFSESWVKIEDARGKTVFSRVLVPGDLYYVPKGNKNKATFGNVGGIDIWVRGELAPKVGKDNTRKTGILLDADALLGVNKSSDAKATTDKKNVKDADSKDNTDKKVNEKVVDEKKS